MQALRSFIFLSAVAIAFGISFVMLAQAIGFASPWLGLLLMFYFLGLARVGEPLFMFRVPRTIQVVRTWEKSGAAYRRLGVYRFGRLLRGTPLRYLNSSVYLPRRGTDLKTLYRHAGSAEAAHFWAAVLFTPYIAFVWLRGQKGVATAFLLVQLLFNVYPILHLRILRGRLDNLFARRHGKRLIAGYSSSPS